MTCLFFSLGLSLLILWSCGVFTFSWLWWLAAIPLLYLSLFTDSLAGFYRRQEP